MTRVCLELTPYGGSSAILVKAECCNYLLSNKLSNFGRRLELAGVKWPVVAGCETAFTKCAEDPLKGDNSILWLHRARRRPRQHLQGNGRRAVTNRG
jgi:hypothetical protein